MGREGLVIEGRDVFAYASVFAGRRGDRDEIRHSGFGLDVAWVARAHTSRGEGLALLAPNVGRLAPRMAVRLDGDVLFGLFDEGRVFECRDVFSYARQLAGRGAHDDELGLHFLGLNVARVFFAYPFRGALEVIFAPSVGRRGPSMADRVDFDLLALDSEGLVFEGDGELALALLLALGLGHHRVGAIGGLGLLMGLVALADAGGGAGLVVVGPAVSHGFPFVGVAASGEKTNSHKS